MKEGPLAMEQTEGQWLAMEEAARRAGKTERTIRSWVQLGRLIKRKVGKRVLVRFAEGYAPQGPPPGGAWRPIADGAELHGKVAECLRHRQDDGALRAARLEGQLAERLAELESLRHEQQAQQQAVADHLSRAAAQRERLRLTEQQLETLRGELDGQRQQLFSAARRIGLLEGETREKAKLLELHQRRAARDVPLALAYAGLGTALTALVGLSLALFQAQDRLLASELEASWLESRAREMAVKRMAEAGRPLPETARREDREFFFLRQRIRDLLQRR